MKISTEFEIMITAELEKAIEWITALSLFPITMLLLILWHFLICSIISVSAVQGQQYPKLDFHQNHQLANL